MLALLLSVGIAAGPPSGPAVGDPPPPPAPKREARASDGTTPDKMVCKTVNPPGSHIPARVCRLASEWEEIRSIDSGERFKRQIWN